MRTPNRAKLAPAVAISLALALAVPLLIAGVRAVAGQDKLPPAKPVPPGPQWTIESHDKTNFPLVGKHRTLSCRECHINLVFEGTPTDCEACHWIRRQDDRYSLRLGTRCSDCHTPQSWKKVDPALWSHEVNAGYKLEGVHRTLDCEACHGTAGFEPQPTACYGCHAADYQGTEDPNHVQAGFPTTCADCHNQRSFEDASFPHTAFPLSGRHATASCTDCHKNGVYEGTSPACASCHLNDYNGTTDPNHQASGFPLDCTICHGTSFKDWSAPDFNHPFPLSGHHAGASCTDCHQTSDYRVFNCLGCHDRSSTDGDHKGVTGYQYSSPACYACHPNGQAAPSTARPRL